MSEPTASKATKDARGTTRPSSGPPRLLTDDEEKRLTDLVVLHADREKFERQYPGQWLSMSRAIQEGKSLLTRHRLREERRMEEVLRQSATLDVDRQKAFERTLAAYDRGVNAIKSSGVGAVAAAPVLWAASRRGADIEELATLAEVTTQLGDFAAGRIARGRAARPPPSRPSPSPASASRATEDRGTSRAQRSVPLEPVVVPKPPPANDVTPAGRSGRGEVIPLVRPQPAASPLQRTGTDDVPGPAVTRASRASPVPGAISATPQTRQLAVSQPRLVARYEARANEIIGDAVDVVKARQRTSAPRRRLDQLQDQFTRLMDEVANDTMLTPAQRDRATGILREARPLARGDFDGFRNAVNARLRQDPELAAIEGELVRAGDADASGSGALRMRTVDASGAIRFEPLNLEHRTRLSDNPWLYDNRNNLIATDAAQNQQYLEALRKYGVWPTGRIEQFVVRHRLNEQGIDFSPIGTPRSPSVPARSR